MDRFIASLRYDEESFYLVEKGRSKMERSIVWVERGTYRGYGYAPFHFNGIPKEQWKRYVEVKDENRDIRSIINLYLRKGIGFKKISL